MKGITILGATGSIGVSTLEVLRCHPQDYRVVALTANRDVERMLQQCREFLPDYAVMADVSAAEGLAEQVRAEGLSVEVLAGTEGLERVAALPQTDYVMAAIVGAAGLLPTLAAARAGKRVLLANKEALVMSGHLFMQTVRENGAELLPIDSEHNAIHQCVDGRGESSLRSIWLTASGLSLQTNMTQVLVVEGDEPTLELQPSVIDALDNEKAREEAKARTKQVLDTIAADLTTVTP